LPLLLSDINVCYVITLQERMHRVSEITVFDRTSDQLHLTLHKSQVVDCRQPVAEQFAGTEEMMQVSS
jgi:hypothetical protein